MYGQLGTGTVSPSPTSIFDLLWQVITHAVYDRGLLMAHDVVGVERDPVAEMVRAALALRDAQADPALHVAENTPAETAETVERRVRFYVLEPRTIKPLCRIDGIFTLVNLDHATSDKVGGWELRVYIPAGEPVPWLCHTGIVTQDDSFRTFMEIFNDFLNEQGHTPRASTQQGLLDDSLPYPDYRGGRASKRKSVIRFPAGKPDTESSPEPVLVEGDTAPSAESSPESEITESDWKRAKDRLTEVINTYQEIGAPGRPALSLVINPLKKRFDAGERTRELFAEIWMLE